MRAATAMKFAAMTTPILRSKSKKGVRTNFLFGRLFPEICSDPFFPQNPQ